jgi:hypothetical protein
MSPSRSTAPRVAVDVHDSISRCHHTMLTKPECHCRACLLEQMAVHGRRPQSTGFALAGEVDRTAA